MYICVYKLLCMVWVQILARLFCSHFCAVHSCVYASDLSLSLSLFLSLRSLSSLSPLSFTLLSPSPCLAGTDVTREGEIAISQAIKASPDPHNFSLYSTSQRSSGSSLVMGRYWAELGLPQTASSWRNAHVLACFAKDREDKWTAWGMGMHLRLGACSPVRLLDGVLLGMVWEQLFLCASLPP